MVTTATDTPIGTDAPPESSDDRGPKPVLACVPDDPTTWRRIGMVYAHFAAITGTACRPAAGSIEGVCLSCGCKIWIGPSQQQHPDLHTLCLVCAMPFAVDGNPAVPLARDGTPVDGINIEPRD